MMGVCELDSANTSSRLQGSGSVNSWPCLVERRKQVLWGEGGVHLSRFQGWGSRDLLSVLTSLCG